jgi:hypothetical protein
MNVRLVAYRPVTTSATVDTTYELELQEAPNVSLNFQFSDIKEPETRKGSYSQTFKLPFTNKNNEFFQNWFNVNLETLVFNTRTKFDAVLYIGTIPQFEGVLQLKSVYQKAQVYEVVLMSNTASLFSTIGEQKLQDVFKNDDGSYDAQFNHVFNETNLAASWGSSLQNTGGTSLYDSDGAVSKIVYPISVTQKDFYFNPNDTDADGNDVKRYLRLDSSAITAINDSTISSDLSVSLSQFRPAIQLKSLIKLIVAKAGFSYTSDFIDKTGSSGGYFCKLFMTTGNHLELSAIPTTNTNANPSGFMDVGNSAQWGLVTLDAYTEQNTEHLVVADTVTATTNNTAPQDADNIWNETYSYFTREDINMTQVRVKHVIAGSNVAAFNTSAPITAQAILRPIDFVDGEPVPNYNFTYAESGVVELDLSSNNLLGISDWNLDLTQMEPGSSAQIVILLSNYTRAGGGAGSLTIRVGNTTEYSVLGWEVGNDLYSNIRIDWVGYSNDIYGATVDIPSCIDPEITQRAFLKDIIERFNLLIITDPNDPTNLIIEPYNDYLADGDIKYWTDKLDLSKEIVVKDTTTLQKKTIHLTDQEDDDLYNKEFKERFPDVNVYGHLKIDEINNDFATGEMKNTSIFSPFINSQVFASEDTQIGTYLPNFSPQYEISYEQRDGQTEPKVVKTKPKLFYYNGAATTVLDTAGSSTSYNLHRVYNNSGTVTVTAFNFTTYPVCSPFDITPSSNIYTLTSSTKSLYWNSSPPLVGNLSVFNFNDSVGSWFNNALYGLYWKNYIDSLYSTEARIMECYLNLSEVDIFNFKFNDEIFIKDTYWRILNISNYQVGAQASTKVTLLKIVDSLVQCEGCDYVLGEINGNNTFGNLFYLWCSENDPDCTPDIGTGFPGLYTTPVCCTCNGGTPFYWATANTASGLYPCLANSGSLPIRLKSIFSATSILSNGQLKTLVYDKLGGLKRPFIRGVNNTKYSKSMLPLYGDDIIIKYGTKKRDIPQLEGESHRIVLSGNTSGNTRGYAYPEGDVYSTPLRIPNNINMIIRVKGIVTVVGGSSSTYSLGYTEGFAYYTAFKNKNGTITQLSTAGGQQEFSIREGANPTTCTLYISTANDILRFGLDDNQTDTKRVWQLSVDLDINRINNFNLGYDENWAIYQNSQNIELQNGDYLLWN